MNQPETSGQRAIEDRLLVIETKLNYLATGKELSEQGARLTADIAKVRDDLRTDITRVRDDLRTFYFQGFSAVTLLIVAATFVNHFWK